MKKDKFYESYFEEISDETQVFYHSTSTTRQIEKTILPAVFTGNLREEWLTKMIDKVFLTNSLRSAKQYAKKHPLNLVVIRLCILQNLSAICGK